VLAHGAGGNAQGPVLVSLGEEFAGLGFHVLRIDLPFRQERRGPPRPTDAKKDQAGIRAAGDSLRARAQGRIFLGGHSYGGRMSSMLVADDNSVAAGMLLSSYPLHPPGKPDQLRTAHFSKLTLPVFFAHGTRDPFGTIDEVRKAIALIPGKTELFVVEGAGHDLKGKRDGLATAFLKLVESSEKIHNSAAL